MGARLFVIACAVILLTSCAMYHLQIPETLAVGKISGGAGLTGSAEAGQVFAFPGFWIRTGIAPKADIGVHTWGLGIKMDGKYGLNEYFGLGAGGAVAFMGAIIYGAEGSLYLGVPSKILYPYGVIRLSTIGISGEFEDNSFFESVAGLSAVGGIKIRFGTMLSTMFEGGIIAPLFESGGETQPVFGIGVSIGH